MRYLRGYIVAIVTVAVVLIGLLSLSGRRTGQPACQNLKIACTTSMLADLIAQIAQQHASVKGLMGPGVDPHVYHARESDVRTLAHADIIFYNGLHLEGKLADLLKRMSTRVPTVAISTALAPSQLRASEFQSTYDPHIWHDVLLWIQIARYVTTVLIQHDPARADFYTDNAQQYITALYALDQYIVDQAAKISPEQRILVTAHDAFHYFGKRYGFTVVGLQGINTDAHISTKDIHDLADFIVANRVKALFVESSVSPRNINAVQKAVQAKGWSVVIGPALYSDALGESGLPVGTYIGMMKHNIDTIVSALL
jgi:manganese/zinc/iron transport system substrate-binding protein